MIPAIEAFVIIQKPVREVFEAVSEPSILSAYFVTGGASAPLKEGTTVYWEFADFPGPFPVKVKQVQQDRLIVIEWPAAGGAYNTQTSFKFESLNPDETKVSISETGWKEDEAGIIASYRNCQGWAQMAMAMKAYLEYGINLRKGAYKALADY